MITKNSEDRIERTLKSVNGLVDEIIVVDTGSSDNTREIASEYGKVFDFEWVDDFSKARNYAYSKATGDWILNLDDDETVSEIDFDKIKEFVSNSDDLGFYLEQRNYTNEPGNNGWVSSKDDKYKESKIAYGYVPQIIVRLFKNDKRIRSIGVIHDSVVQSIEQLGTLGKIDAVIHHYGTLERNREKTLRYIEIEKKNIRDDYYQEFQIGVQYASIGMINESISHFTRSLQLNQDFYLTWLELGLIFIKLGKVLESKPLILQSLRLNNNEMALNTLGIIEAYDGKMEEALDYFKRAIEMNPKNADFYFNAGQALKKLENKDEAKEMFVKAMYLNPLYKDKIK